MYNSDNIIYNFSINSKKKNFYVECCDKETETDEICEIIIDSEKCVYLIGENGYRYFYETFDEIIDRYTIYGCHTYKPNKMLINIT